MAKLKGKLATERSNNLKNLFEHDYSQSTR